MNERTIYCPKCKYPNPASRSKCFKCNADLYVEITLDDVPETKKTETPRAFVDTKNSKVPPTNIATPPQSNIQNREAAQPFDNVFKGVNGDIILLQNSIIIRRQGLLLNYLYGLKGEKEIFIKEISSIQFKEPGTITTGYIQFAFKGGTESHGAYINAAIEDENTVTFADVHRFRLLRNILQEKINQLNSPQVINNNAPSPAQEIERLASLMQQGFITREEFEAGKRRILGI